MSNMPWSNVPVLEIANQSCLLHVRFCRTWSLFVLVNTDISVTDTAKRGFGDIVVYFSPEPELLLLSFHQKVRILPNTASLLHWQPKSTELQDKL